MVLINSGNVAKYKITLQAFACITPATHIPAVLKHTWQGVWLEAGLLFPYSRWLVNVGSVLHAP